MSIARPLPATLRYVAVREPGPPDARAIAERALLPHRMPRDRRRTHCPSWRGHSAVTLQRRLGGCVNAIFMPYLIP